MLALSFGVPLVVALAGAAFLVFALVERNPLLWARGLIVGGWGIYAVTSPNLRIPNFFRPIPNVLFAVGAILHWQLIREEQRGKRDPNRRIALSSRLIVVYAAFVLMGCFFSPDGPSNIVRGVQGVLIIGTAFYASRVGLMTDLLKITFVAALYNTVITVIQQKPELDYRGAPTGRLAGDLQPNHLAFAAAEVMIGVMWALPRKPSAKLPYLGQVSLKWPLIGSFAVASYAMYASESRTAWLAVAPALLIAYFTAPHPPGKRMKVVVYSVVILALASPIVLPGVESYLSRDSSASQLTSLTGRTDFWPLAVDLIKQRPIIGWGVDVIDTPVGAAFQEVTAGAIQAHNAYLEAALQAGLIGAAAFAISLIAMLVGSFRLPRADDYRPLIIAGTILTLMFTITESNPAWFGDMFVVYVMCLAMYGERLPGRLDLRQPVQRSRRLVSA